MGNPKSCLKIRMSGNKYLPKVKKEGKISYNKNILKSIIKLAIAEVDDVTLAKCKNDIVIKFMPDEIFVTACVVITREHCVTEVSYKIQENIKRNVETMTEYKINKIDINVIDINVEKEKI